MTVMPQDGGGVNMRLALRSLLSLAAVVAVVFSTASAASAANLLPNPSFEDLCGQALCGWYDNPGFAEQDTTFAHTGSASYKITIPSGSSGISGGTLCIHTALAAGTAPLSYWYLTNEVSLVQGYAFYYPNGTCNGSATVSDPLAMSAVQGTWTLVSGTVNVPGGTQSFEVGLFVGRSCPCPASASAYFDDIDFQQAPTAVRSRTLSAEHRGRSVVLRWRTAQETAMLGFNLYREAQGKFAKLNRALIPSVFGGTTRGHAYSWLDRSAPTRGNVRYRLQAVDLNGTRSWMGSTRVN